MLINFLAVKSHRPFLRRLDSCGGFTLLEAIIGLVLVSALGAGVMATLNSLSKGAKTLGASGEASFLKTQINALINNDMGSCAKALQDSSGNTATFNPDVTLPDNPSQAQIDAYNAANSLSQIGLGSMTVAKLNQNAGGLWVRSLGLKELDSSLRQNTTVNGTSARKFIAALNLSLSTSSTNSDVGIPKTISLPIVVTAATGNNRILSCGSMASTSPSTGAATTTSSGRLSWIGSYYDSEPKTGDGSNEPSCTIAMNSSKNWVVLLGDSNLVIGRVFGGMVKINGGAKEFGYVVNFTFDKTSGNFTYNTEEAEWHRAPSGTGNIKDAELIICSSRDNDCASFYRKVRAKYISSTNSLEISIYPSNDNNTATDYCFQGVALTVNKYKTE